MSAVATLALPLALAQLPGGLLGIAVLFLVLALVAYLLGAGGVAGVSMDIAKILIVVFLILAVLAFLGNVLA